MSDRFYNAVTTILRVLSKPLVRLRVEGIENIPLHGAVILVPNHVAVLDPILTGSRIAKRRPVRALAKESLFRTPIISFVMRKMEHIPVHRGSATAADALQAAESRLIEKQQMIAVYAQGTVPKDLTTIGKLKTGAMRLALATEATVIPIAQWGAQDIFPRGENVLKSLWQALIHRPVHRVVIGTPFKLESDSAAHETLRLQATLEEMVTELRGLRSSHHHDTRS
jgi:1-acyl-sn-glycerol-3-phosphate acyltransferase